jgi:hypothetical protein
MVKPKQAAIKVSHFEAVGVNRGGIDGDVTPSGERKALIIESSESPAERLLLNRA